MKDKIDKKLATRMEEVADVDWTQLIVWMGGPAKVARMMPYPEINSKTVRQWWQRGSVPGKYVVPLLMLAEHMQAINGVYDLPKRDPFAQVYT